MSPFVKLTQAGHGLSPHIEFPYKGLKSPGLTSADEGIAKRTKTIMITKKIIKNNPSFIIPLFKMNTFIIKNITKPSYKLLYKNKAFI